MKKLYKFHADCGRMGDVESIFVADPMDVQSVVGQTAYFGEILGKHSDVTVEVDKCHFNKIDIPEDVLNTLVDVLGETWSGHNPLDYVRCDGCDLEMYACECDNDY